VPRHRLSVLCAALLLAACGSSGGGSGDASSGDGTPTATATAAATVSSAGLERLPAGPSPAGAPPSSESSTQGEFLRRVFDDVEVLWQHEFHEAGLTYRPARLTIFRQQAHTACGIHGADVGPFYCPASFGVYLDPAFFSALSRKVGVRLGDFAQAYVVAHEVAHHVQTVLGITHQKALADHEDPAGANGRSVRFELQADCLAGVWAHSVYARGDLEPGDIEEGLTAASSVGDDRIQAQAGMRVNPETWTHGSSEERQRWFETGFESGRSDDCDTFG
jgi:uncharacterized protein